MKAASAATLAILAGGKYLLADLYDITLQNGTAYHFTSFQVPLSAAIHPSATINSYLTGLTISRGSTTQEVGLNVQEMELTLSAQWDNPGGAVQIGGYPLIQAARIGILDGATVLFSKLFMNFPAAGATLDTSPKGVAWFQGNIAEIDPVGRFSLVVKVACGLQFLNVQMPRNLYQSGCSHTVYDAGCTLVKASFTTTGAVSAAASRSQFTSGLTAIDDYYDLGVVKFTSGANAGFSATVKRYLHTSGTIQTVMPFPNAITAGDAFSIYPGCDRTLTTCINKFNNLPHNKSEPFVPVTETLYDGGTSNPPSPSSPGSQAGSTIGSRVGGRIQP